MTKVIAITGCMGSGKTTLVQHLHQLIPGSHFLIEDDYQTMTQMDLEQLRRWVTDGSCIDDLNLNGFDTAIASNIRVDSSDSISGGPKILLIESQFGRAHSALVDLVDYQIWIDSPLDFCLARKIIELSQTRRDSSVAALEDGQLGGFCRNYLDLTAHLLRKQKILVEAVSNHILVNDRSVSWLVDQALEVLHKQTPYLIGLDLH